MYESSPPPELPPPTLPLPPPRVAQPNATSGPARPFSAVTHETLAAQPEAPTTAKTGRPRRNNLVTSIIIFAALFGTTYLVLDAHDSEPTSATVPPGSEFTVDTPDYHFVLPAEPTVKTGAQQMFGATIPTSQWTVGAPGLTFNVIAINFGMAVDDSMAQGAFDAMDGELARTMNGDVVSQDPILKDGVIVRRTVIDNDDAKFTLYHFAKGPWFVSIIGGAAGADPPDLIAIRDSFIFR